MSISKLLTSILLFQSAVQATSFEEKYQDCIKNKDNDAAEKIAKQIQEMKDLGVDPQTKIVYNPSQASTIAEAYAYYLINKRENFANKTEKHIQEMQDLGISVNTNIVRPLNDNLSLEDKYVHYIINTDFEAAEKTAKEIRYRNFVTKTRSQMDDVLGNFKILTKEVEEKQKNLQNIENQKDDLLEKIKQLTDQVKEEKQTLKQLTDQVKEEKQKLKTIETEAENTSNFFKKLAAQIGTDKKQTFWQKIKNFFLGDPNTKLQAKLPDDLNILISTKLEYLEAVKKAISAGEKKLEKEKLSKSNTFKNLGKIEEK